MRRKRQQLAEEESIGILQKATSGTLALMGDNDYPYAVPISYVYHEGKLYFHSALTGHKVDAIRKCDKASFCVIYPGALNMYFLIPKPRMPSSSIKRDRQIIS